VTVAIRIRSITPVSRVMLISNAELVEDVPLGDDRRSIDYETTVPVRRSGWLHVRAEGVRDESYPLDTGFAQGFTNPVWVTVGDQPVRDLESAEYSIEWIDKLTAMAEAAPGWRSQWEKDHVFAQFQAARALYERFAREARGDEPTTSIEPRSDCHPIYTIRRMRYSVASHGPSSLRAMCLLRPVVGGAREVPPLPSPRVLRRTLEATVGALAERERELVVRRVPGASRAGEALRFPSPSVRRL